MRRDRCSKQHGQIPISAAYSCEVDWTILKHQRDIVNAMPHSAPVPSHPKWTDAFDAVAIITQSICHDRNLQRATFVTTPRSQQGPVNKGSVTSFITACTASGQAILRALSFDTPPPSPSLLLCITSDWVCNLAD